MTVDLSRYRPNVGVALFHPDGRVWLGRRIGAPDPFVWQFPQGGVDEGEGWLEAARRELLEETGVVSAEYLGETEGFITYDFPPGVGHGPYRGQKQKWFAMRFTGEESEIDLEAHPPVEFSDWRWGRLADMPELIVPFKRAAYEQMIAAFSRFAAS